MIITYPSQTITLELSLVNALKQNSERAFGMLVKNYSKAMSKVISKYLKCEEDQEDALQELWIKVYTKIQFFDQTKSGLYCWMTRIATNLCIDKLRKSSKVSLHDLGAYENVLKSHDDYRKVEYLGLKGLINELNPKEQEISQLYFLKQYTHKEISEELGIPIGTSKSRLRTGLSRMQKLCGQEMRA